MPAATAGNNAPFVSDKAFSSVFGDNESCKYHLIFGVCDFTRGGL